MVKLYLGALLVLFSLFLSMCSLQPDMLPVTSGDSSSSASSAVSAVSASSDVAESASSSSAASTSSAVSASSAAATSSAAAIASGSASSASSVSIPDVPAGEYVTLRAAQAKALIDGGNVTIVDVRTQDEYDGEHLPGAILVPLDTIKTTQPEALPDLDATLLVYCRSGVRSAQACKALVAIGYTRVYNLDGGISAWHYETVTD